VEIAVKFLFERQTPPFEQSARRRAGQVKSIKNEAVSIGAANVCHRRHRSAIMSSQRHSFKIIAIQVITIGTFDACYLIN